MVEQCTWVPLPRRRPRKPKVPDVLERASRLIDWYRLYRPTVNRLAVSRTDYAVFEEAVGDFGIYLTPAGLHYREFIIYVAP